LINFFNLYFRTVAVIDVPSLKI